MDSKEKDRQDILASILTSVDEWVNYARNDLRSSVLLFRANDFRNALYLLQQASEKLTKAVLKIALWTLDESKVSLSKEGESDILSTKSLGHNPYLKILKFMQKRFSGINTSTIYDLLQSIEGLPKESVEKAVEINPAKMIETEEKLQKLDPETLTSIMEPLIGSRPFSGAADLAVKIGKLQELDIIDKRLNILIPEIAKKEALTPPPVSSVKKLINYYVPLYLDLLIPTFYVSSTLQSSVELRYPPNRLSKKFDWIVENFNAIADEISDGLNYIETMINELKNDPYSWDSLLLLVTVLITVLSELIGTKNLGQGEYKT